MCRLRTVQIAVDVDAADSGANLYTDISDIATQLAVDTTGDIASSDTIKIDDEQMTVNAVDTGVGGCLVARGAQGSTPATHALGADVFKLVDTTRTLYVDHDAVTLKFAVSASAGIAPADKVTIGNEQLLVDAVDTTVGGVAVTRAQSSSVGATHAAGATVYKKVDTTRTLNGGINASVTSITLDDTTGISNGDTIIVDGELITVTTVLNGTVLSVVVRGANGSVAASHLTAAAVYKRTAATTTLYIATSAIATALALDTIANLANGDVIVIDAEQIAYVTETGTVDGFTVLARAANSTTAAVHAAAVAIFLVTDTTDNLYTAATAAATAMAFDAIAGFSDGNVLLIDAERITATTKSATVNGVTITARHAGGTVAAAHVAPADIYNFTAGDGTGSADSENAVVGEILEVYINFNGSLSATADVTLKTKGNATGIPSHDILVTTDVITDGVFYPRAKPVDKGNAAITNAFTPFVVADKLTVAVAQADKLTAGVVVTVLYRQMSG